MSPYSPFYVLIGLTLFVIDIYWFQSHRFVGLPAPELQNKLGASVKDIETEVEGLNKRLHYLETTAKNSQEHIEKMLKGGQA